MPPSQTHSLLTDIPATADILSRSGCRYLLSQPAYLQIQENQFLLGLGVSCAAVLTIAIVLMSFMWQSFKHEQRLQDQVGPCLPCFSELMY
jgi:hypothetical protein